jgi:hypothetical protein
MMRHGVEFYKNLFLEEGRQDIRLDDDFWETEEKVTKDENLSLEAKISEDKMKRAIDSSYAEGGPNPDGFSFMFYQKFWHVIKEDFMPMIRHFEQGEINVARINYALIILIPKEEDAGNFKKKTDLLV